MSAADKFSPGPWVAQGRDHLEVMGPDFGIVTLDAPKNDREAYEAAQADARLIAAAPDMLAALRCAERLINEALPKFDWKRSALDANAIRLLNEVPRCVREAIEKAVGK